MAKSRAQQSMRMSGAENARVLLDRFHEGARDAFALIYRSHSPTVYRFALHMTGDPSRATEFCPERFHLESQHVYCDSMGRTRVESGEPGKETVAILDPVGGFNITLEPETLTARKRRCQNLL